MAQEPPPEREQGANIVFEGDHFPRLVKETTTWEIYNNEARKVDNELVKDWTATLNFLLLFAAIFAAVLTAFIIESKKLLEPDYSESMYMAMLFHMDNLANGNHTLYPRSNFEPDATAISINCLFFGSLSASLVAALASVIALQWVADFDALITRGGSSPQDRAKRRQFRFAGVQKWKMGEIIAALPLILYFSVVLFFAGLIQWMIYLHTIVAYVVIGGGIAALLFYFSSTILAVVFVSAPYKTPISRWIYSASYFPITLSHWIFTAMHVENLPSWITNYREGYLTAHKREDLAITTRKDLNYQAMNWLVRQVSISEDSRRRLVILVGELAHWDMAQLEFADFAEGPWIAILNFLYFTPTRRANQKRTREETRAFFRRARARFDRSTSAFGLERSRSDPVVIHYPEPSQPLRNQALTQDEVRAFRKAWNAFDTTNTGYITSKQIGPFLFRLSGALEVRVYPAYHHVRALYRRSTDLMSMSSTPGLARDMKSLLELVNKDLKSLDYEEVNRRRKVYNRVFWEARLLAEREVQGISFLRMLVLLGYNRVIDEEKTLEIDEIIRGRAFADELDTLILMDKVRSTFRMIYWRRKFLKSRESRLAARTTARATALEERRRVRAYLSEGARDEPRNYYATYPVTPFEEPVPTWPYSSMHSDEPVDELPVGSRVLPWTMPLGQPVRFTGSPQGASPEEEKSGAL